MIVRKTAHQRIAALARQFPVVLILGPRQCGKTTLAKAAVAGRYFDLEKSSDRQVFTDDAEYALRHIPEPLVFDEAQTMPALFPTLRALVDEHRTKRGRFYLLGSVNPALIKGIAESLAGRVGVLDLTPFLFSEIAGKKTADSFHTLWIRGGFPDAFLADDDNNWQTWMDNYIRTFVERDIARHELKISSFEMRRFITMLAHLHGGLLNASDLGRAMGVTYHTIQHALDVLEGYFLVRRLRPWQTNLGKRLIRASKVYIRDSGLLHYLTGISGKDRLLVSPNRGKSFEGFMIEQMLAQEALTNTGSGGFFYRTHAGAEIDLIVERDQERVGYEFKSAMSSTPRDWATLKAGVEEGIIKQGFVIYLGEREFDVSDTIGVRTAEHVLNGRKTATHTLALMNGSMPELKVPPRTRRIWK